MSLIPDSAYRLLQVLAAVIALALGTVFICFSTAGVVMLQLLAAGTNKYLALGMAILVAIACSAFIAFNHKIRNFINNRGANTDE